MLQAEQGNIEEVQRLLASGKKFDINQVNKKGSTALALGIKSGSLAVTKELIAAGADVNIKNHVICLFLTHCSCFRPIKLYILAIIITGYHFRVVKALCSWLAGSDLKILLDSLLKTARISTQLTRYVILLLSISSLFASWHIGLLICVRIERLDTFNDGYLL